ncbi:PorV/PorQ family protein [candidate division KSB1 bacterium]|nr:PorV/PorQ family protein [candidate division KSB1 bacterium]RQW01404.1 MAG: PorV/PorQ family protein [candidate division KSB1 bacterium]
MKINRNIARVCILLAFLLPASLFCAEIAKYAGEFMSTGVGARALGMGGAYVAAGGDVTYGYWNPAGLSQLNFPELAAMHSERFAGVVNYDYLAFSLPLRQKETIAVSAIRLGIDDIPISAIPRADLQVDTQYTDDDGTARVNRPYVARYVSDAEYAFYFSYARQYSSALAFGTNAKFVRKGVGDHSAWGIGFDVGAIWNPWRRLMVGVSIQDVTTTLLAWDTGRKELIAPTAKPGVCYPFTLPFLRSRLLLASDVDVRFEGRQSAAQAHLGGLSFDFRLGGEISFYDIIALRLGRDDLGNLTAGAGLILSRLDIDYAFSQHTELESTHRVSLCIRLEEKRFARK